MATQHVAVKRLRAPLDGFIVDGFHYCQPDVRHYLLTHAHSDHTCGLHASFDLGTIYCSSTTARILRATLGVQPKVQQTCPCVSAFTMNSPCTTFVVPLPLSVGATGGTSRAREELVLHAVPAITQPWLASMYALDAPSCHHLTAD